MTPYGEEVVVIGSARRSAKCAAVLVLAGAAWLGSAGLQGQPLDSRGREGWVEVDYAELVDERRLTHSGEPVGTLLRRLDGRPVPPPGERPGDATAHKLLEPVLEPYGFVLPDALDTLQDRPDPPLVEIAWLWEEGTSQPAWVELLRARQYLVESDGRGRMRVFLPARESQADPSDAAAHAWDRAWPVLVRVLASERRRLQAGGEPGTLRVEAYPYVHDPARTRYLLGTVPLRRQLTGVEPGPSRAPLDLRAWERFLARGLVLEGARLEADGTVRLIGSETERPPTILGRGIALSDMAVAYRAVFHGGLAEPYMSLDRGEAPWLSRVNYGGRLRDTSLGMVSLLCDVRFKTFSLGMDVQAGTDVRARLRQDISGFRTHLERFAADPASGGTLGQQTRLWFYPDDVDLTLSEQGDVLVVRRARMTAASERVVADAAQAGGEPPWTRDTIKAVNAGYDALARPFPELGDLDQVVRLLALFTWLKQAEREGLPVPDLDALLDVELPALPTPRTFPQLLTFNALPAADAGGGVDVFERAEVAEGLERLRPSSDRRLSPRRRLERSLAALDPRQADHAAMLAQTARIDLDGLDAGDIDLLAYRAERLRMHALVLSTLPTSRRDALLVRRRQGEDLRVFSVGIGGLDLGMGRAVQHASRRRLGLRGEAATSGPVSRAGPAGDGNPGSKGTGGEVRHDSGSRDPGAPSPVLPASVLPAHALSTTDAGVLRWITSERPPFVAVLAGPDGAWPRMRRLHLVEGGRAGHLARLEDGRLLGYRLETRPKGLIARLDPGPPEVPEGPTPAPPAGAGLVTVELVPGEGEMGAATGEVALQGSRAFAEPVTVGVRLRGNGSRDLTADLPRGVLQRLVLGPALDPSGNRSIPGLLPLPSAFAGERRLMILADASARSAPWEMGSEPRPGEEDPVRVADALNRWWRREGAAQTGTAVVGVDATASPQRWQRAPSLAGNVRLQLPEDAFPGSASRLRKAMQETWMDGPVPSSQGATAMVVLVSAEAPGALGARLRALAKDPALEQSFLAVWSLGGPIRADLPASLLAEGKLAGVGVAVHGPVHLDEVSSELRAFARALTAARPSEASTVSSSSSVSSERGGNRRRRDRRPPAPPPTAVAGSQGIRAEDLPGPLVWFY